MADAPDMTRDRHWGRRRGRIGGRIDRGARTGLNGGVSDCGVDLYWLPVGAGTSRFQQASLRLWEAVEAARARRARMRLLHSALKLSIGAGEAYTLELTPAFIGGAAPPLATGPVGIRGADRFRLFRYQLRCLPGEQLPDEEWAVGAPARLSDDCAMVRRVLDMAPSVPKHVWGRRVAGTGEMWTSDSVISWLLVRAGIELANIAPPAGGRAPGWYAGIAMANGADSQERQ